ncbi:MAG: hypothetical protein ACD_75C00303G0001 [uncultured bacterium]|nr:MAG: hypothetical protein ACD_75C00303G0001 [uncultured bacterium]
MNIPMDDPLLMGKCQAAADLPDVLYRQELGDPDEARKKVAQRFAFEKFRNDKNGLIPFFKIVDLQDALMVE